MAHGQFSVYLDDDLTNFLKEAAKARKTTMAAIIRDAIVRLRATDKDLDHAIWRARVGRP